MATGGPSRPGTPVGTATAIPPQYGPNGQLLTGSAALVSYINQRYQSDPAYAAQVNADPSQFLGQGFSVSNGKVSYNPPGGSGLGLTDALLIAAVAATAGIAAPAAIAAFGGESAAAAAGASAAADAAPEVAAGVGDAAVAGATAAPLASTSVASALGTLPAGGAGAAGSIASLMAPAAAATTPAAAAAAPAAASSSGLVAPGTASLISGGAGAAASIYGSKQQANAAENAANTQAATSAAALAFQKQQAEALYQQQETTNLGNYQQWAAGQGAKNAWLNELDLPQVQIPAFVPMPDPNLAGTPTAVPRQPGNVPAGTSAPVAPSVSQALAPPAQQPRQAAPLTLGQQQLAANAAPGTPSLPNANAPSNAFAGQSPAAYAQSMLAKGMPPQQVAATVNQMFGLTTGQTASFNPSTGMLQLPGGVTLPVPSAGSSTAPNLPQSIGSYLGTAPAPQPQPYYGSVGEYLASPMTG